MAFRRSQKTLENSKTAKSKTTEMKGSQHANYKLLLLSARSFTLSVESNYLVMQLQFN